MPMKWLIVIAPILLTAEQAGPESGRDIARKAQMTQFGYKTLTVSGEMTLRRGADIIGQRTIAVELIEHEAEDKYDQARITITSPSALKDTRLLSWSTGKGDDQQWLLTPRTHRVQRIADRGRQAAFVSSDFSYEDILKWQLDDYDYTRAGQGACPAGTCVLVDAKPRNPYSAYRLLKVYYDPQYRISRVDCFDEAVDRPRKTLAHSGYMQYGGTWQPSRSVMTDLERETSTEVVWSGYAVNVPIDERIMAPSAMDR
jgi:hypothetical protein